MNPIAWALSFLPAAAVYGLAGLLLLAGVASVIYALFPLPYRRTATIAGPVIIGLSCWFGGIAAGQAVSEAAALQAKLAAAQAVVAQQQAVLSALHMDSLSAAANASDLQKLQDRIHELESRTPAGACLDLPTSDGVRSLWD
ncbi:MAG: hypothetical protein AB1592_19310 [Pseudomonadota bacterium]